MSPTDHLLPTHSATFSQTGVLAGRPKRGSWLRKLLLKLRHVFDDQVLVASASAASVPVATRREQPKQETLMEQALSRSTDEHPEHAQCSVGLVLTGGTIGAEEADSVLSVGEGPTEAERELVASVWPGSSEPRICVASPLRRLSENLNPREWLPIADSVRSLVEQDEVESVLVLHGTDTMAYTAAALSFLLSDLNVPIILTGSNVPSAERGSDAARNVRASLIAIPHLNRGTYVVFAGGPNCPGKVYLGTHVRKLIASSRKAFIPVNRELVGVVKDDHFEEREPYEPVASVRYRNAIDERVLTLRLYPGLDLDMIYEAIVAHDFQGVVLELYASATGPDTEDRFSVTNFIRRCTEGENKKGKKIVVGTTVAVAPRTNGKTYETTVAIHAAGGIFLRDMLPEVATVKMMWALAQSDDRDEVRDLLLRPVAGEISAA